MKNHIEMNADQYDIINRKLSIFDIDLGSQDLILRLDLDVALSPFVAPQKISDALSLAKSDNRLTSIGKQSNTVRNKSDLESNISISPLGEQEDWWKTR